MTEERERPSDPSTPEEGFGAEEEPDWVAGIHEARRRRAKRLAALLSDPEAASDPQDPPP